MGLKVELIEKIDPKNPNKPKNWDVIQWTDVQNDIYIIYAGRIRDTTLTAIPTLAELKLATQDGYKLAMIDLTEFSPALGIITFDPPVAQYTTPTLVVSPGKKYKVPYKLVNGKEQTLSGNIHIRAAGLTIYTGQHAIPAIDENKEFTVGAFTVANLNDTDGDGNIDNVDSPVEKSTVGEGDEQKTIGEDEEDLMKLVVEGPEIGRSKVTVVSGSVEFWQESTKKTKIEKEGDAIFIAGSALPKTVWVEATAASNALRDIELKLGFETPGGDLIDDLDKVRMTAVWATKTGMKNQNGDELWQDAGDPLLSTFNDVLGDFGIIFDAGKNNFYYAIGFEFTVSPSGIGDETDVFFDITRDIAHKDWSINGLTVKQEIRPGKDDVFDPRDKSDDDGSDGNDNTPQNNRIYSIDGPGEFLAGSHDQFVSRNNFEEFVRVSFDGIPPTGNNNTGSRCSENIPWHAFYWVEKNTTTEIYQRRVGKTNQVDEGHLDLGEEPEP